MSDTSAVRYLQIGKTTLPDATVPSLTHIRFQGELPYPRCNPGKAEVRTRSDDGQQAASVDGANMSGGFGFKTLLGGKGAGAGNGTAAACNPELADLLDVVMGMEGQKGTGDTSDADTHTTTSIKLADTSLFYDGTDGTYAASGMLMLCGTDYIAREVATVNADTDLVPDRAFPAAPASEAVIYASESWALCPLIADRSHIWADLEGKAWRQIHTGCGVKGPVFEFDGNAPLAYAGWELMANEIDYDTAVDTPTWSSPSDIPGIAVPGSEFWIGSTKTALRKLTIDCAQDPQKKITVHGANGHYGYVYAAEAYPTWTAELYWDQTLYEALMTAGTTHDLGFQLGAPSSAARLYNTFYFRSPAVECTGEPTQSKSPEGVDIMNVTFTCRRPAAGLGALRIHAFASAA